MFLQVLLVAASAVTATDDAALRAAMAKFDAAYVSALVSAEQGQAEAAKQAAARLDERWTEFRAACYDARPDDAQWKPDFDRAGRAIDEGRKAVEQGDLPAAYQKLKPVGTIFRDLRTRHNIEYALDALTEFRETLEALEQSVKGKTPESLSDSDMAHVREESEKTRGRWVVVEKAVSDTDLFNFNDARRAAYRDAVAAEKGALSVLEMALDKKDKNTVLQQVAAAREAFARLIAAYGEAPGG